MHLFLTSVLPFLAHNHPAVVVFLTCRHHNFHASIIPEFLSNEARVRTFCEARQQNQIKADTETQYKNLYSLFVQTPLMQFSPSLVLRQEDCAESILKPLLATKYFRRTLQRCVVLNCVNSGLFLGLSKVQTLTNLDLRRSKVENQHLEIIINTFPSLETLTICDAQHLKITTIYPKTALFITSPPPPATRTLRSLTMHIADPLFATTFVPHFPNLRKLELGAHYSSQELDLGPLSSSLPLLTDVSLKNYDLQNIESLKNLVHLSILEFTWCRMTELSFLSQENNLPHLTELRIDGCDGIATSSEFTSLYHAPNLRVLEIACEHFDNGCLEYLGNTIHLRNLDLRGTEIVGDSRLLKTLMQNLFQLEELNLSGCYEIGNRGAITGALYSTHSRLRVLDLGDCGLVDDDMRGIDALKNTLEVLNLDFNLELTNEALRYCKDLVKLKRLDLAECIGIDDLSPLKDCVILEELDARQCKGLTDNSFKVFSDEPNSFPNLRILTVFNCRKLTEKFLDHLSKNNHLVHRLKELNFDWVPIREIFLSSPAVRNNLYKLKGLRRIPRFLSCFTLMPIKSIIEDELKRKLKNLDEFFSLDEM